MLGLIIINHSKVCVCHFMATRYNCSWKMETEKFNNKAGELQYSIYKGKTCLSFVPHMLPVQYFPSSWRLIEKYKEASVWLDKLGDMADDEFAVKRFSRALARREAAASARVEGTIGDTIDMCIYEVNGQRWLFGANKVDPGINNLKELSNSFVALMYSLSKTKEDVSLDLLCECQKKLVEGVNPIKDPKPGYLREEQVIIGKEGASVEDATFVPPPPHLVLDLMDNLIEYLNSNDDSLPLLFKVALAHYYFEAIHPFRDGNGRTGRILIQFLLYKWGICKVPGLTLARYFELHNDEYRKRLLLVSQQGDYDGWFKFFFDGVAFQAKEDVLFLKSIEKLKSDWDRRIDDYFKKKKLRRTKNLSQILELIITQPYFTPAMVQSVLKLPKSTVYDIFEKLEHSDIIIKFPDVMRDSIYYAADVLSVMRSDS